MIKTLREVKNFVRREVILKTRCVLDFHAKKLNEDSEHSELVEQKHILSSVRLLIIVRITLSEHT